MMGIDEDGDRNLFSTVVIEAMKNAKDGIMRKTGHWVKVGPLVTVTLMQASKKTRRQTWNAIGNVCVQISDLEMRAEKGV